MEVLNMMYKQRGKKVNKNTKGYSNLSILERKIYARSHDYEPQYTNRAIMEIAIYNSTVLEKKNLWQRFQTIINKIQIL